MIEFEDKNGNVVLKVYPLWEWLEKNKKGELTLTTKACLILSDLKPIVKAVNWFWYK